MADRVYIKKVENGYVVEDNSILGKTTIHTDFTDMVNQLMSLFGVEKK